MIERIVNSGSKDSKFSVHTKNVQAIPITKAADRSPASNLIFVISLTVDRNKIAPSPPIKVLLSSRNSKSLEQKLIITKYSIVESTKSHPEFLDCAFNAMVIAIPKMAPGRKRRSNKMDSPFPKR